MAIIFTLKNLRINLKTHTGEKLGGLTKMVISLHKPYLRLSWVNTDSDTKLHIFTRSQFLMDSNVILNYFIEMLSNCGFVNLCAIAISSYFSKESPLSIDKLNLKKLSKY